MTFRNLLLLVAIPVFALGLVHVAGTLGRRDDARRRVETCYATLHVRAARLASELARHLRAAVVARAGSDHWERAFVAGACLLLLAAAPVVGIFFTLQGEPLRSHAATAALAALAWSVIIELPGHAAQLPVWACALIVVTLDVLIALIAFSGVTDGPLVTALFRGAAVVALGDVVSAFLGLCESAYGR